MEDDNVEKIKELANSLTENKLSPKEKELLQLEHDFTEIQALLNKNQILKELIDDIGLDETRAEIAEDIEMKYDTTLEMKLKTRAVPYANKSFFDRTTKTFLFGLLMALLIIFAIWAAWHFSTFISYK